MHCTHCGAKVSPREKFCTACGRPIAKSAPKADTSLAPSAPVPAPTAAVAGARQDAASTAAVTKELQAHCTSCGAALEPGSGSARRAGRPFQGRSLRTPRLCWKRPRQPRPHPRHLRRPSPYRRRHPLRLPPQTRRLCLRPRRPRRLRVPRSAAVSPSPSSRRVRSSCWQPEAGPRCGSRADSIRWGRRSAARSRERRPRHTICRRSPSPWRPPRCCVPRTPRPAA